MKIAYLCGSPKKKSMSQNILTAMAAGMGKEHECLMLSADQIVSADEIAKCDALIIAFPLYVDGLPSQLLSTLVNLELPLREQLISGKISEQFCVYPIVNCGFYEPENNILAIEIIKIWCAKTGLKFGRAVAFGGGGAGSGIRFGYGPTSSFKRAIRSLSKEIKKAASGQDAFVPINFPKSLYIKMAHRSWHAAVKKNGLPQEAIYARPGLDNPPHEEVR